MSRLSFGTLEFSGPTGSCRFDSLAGHALQALNLLRRAPRRGITVTEIVDCLAERGYLFLGKSSNSVCSSGVLQPFLRIGVLDHPPGRSHLYVWVSWPAIRAL